MDNEIFKSQVETIARQVAHNNIRLHEIESSPLAGTKASPQSQPKYEQPSYGNSSPSPSTGAKEQHKAMHSPQAMAKASPRTTPVPASAGDASYRSPPSKNSPFNNNWTSSTADEKIAPSFSSSPNKVTTNGRSPQSLTLETTGASADPVMGAEDAFRAMTSPQDSALMMRKRQKGKRSNKTMDDF